VSGFEATGRIWHRHALSGAQLAKLDRVCAMDEAPGARLPRRDDVVAALEPVDRLAQGLMPGARPVRVVVFNKSEAGNWALPWHQDRVIAVGERADVPGYSNWTRKSGVWHVEPPIEIMQRMIFARIHLDAATTENGGLEIALGTHGLGKVADSAVAGVIERPGQEVELCLAERGDILFAKALTLHRSRASQSTASRRAVRIDYSADELPAPLEWEFSA
jgi:ectoine hydroxylase-related dioxygenase (phytanoyl-CoA dioxygenase family)